MDIKLRSHKECFDDIDIGSTFIYLGIVYMRTNDVFDVNAVNLNTGCLTYFTPTAGVTKIRGSFVEEGVEG
ncbi:MAG: hypothetical protein MJ126_04705 [Lachnospiraceae bacterium]|nr:hypothetical protein [Lachnospiraceae bacterium]